MRFIHYLRTAGAILEEWDRQSSLPLFLKNYFRRDKRMGATDRRTVSELVYNYFRACNVLQDFALEERLLAAWFLCHSRESAVLEHLRPEWNRMAQAEAREKLSLLKGKEFSPREIFPFHTHLSGGIDAEGFGLSLLKQPALYIRMREEAAGAIRKQLEAEGQAFREISPRCLALANAVKLDQVLKSFEGLYEVQDLSSQLTGNYFQPQEGERWWDACAGSGGKSLLLHSLEPSVHLWVSDRRPAILSNLRSRFKAAGLADYQLLQLDVLKDDPGLEKEFFDGIILDVPCSGSGTWGRSPEMMALFRKKQIASYSLLQKQIAACVCPYLKPGKSLVYITCSVFAEENEEVARHISAEQGLELEGEFLLRGYEYEADTMFVARLRKPD